MTHSGHFLRKLLLSSGLIIASIAYVVWQNMRDVSSLLSHTPAQSYRTANEALQQTLSQISTSASGTPPTPSQPAASTPQSPMSQPMMGGGTMMRRYVDGSFTGASADAYYGTVQVKAVIQNGKITDVVFLQHPNMHENSVFINGQAMPLLKQEAIQAQSAQVDGVSGATFTSQAFQQSLASALVKAKI